MSKKQINAIPKENLYWTKVSKEDEAYRLEQRLARLKDEQKKTTVFCYFLAVIDEIKALENRMVYYGI